VRMPVDRAFTATGLRPRLNSRQSHYSDLGCVYYRRKASAPNGRHSVKAADQAASR
jgi:hypothetical protein